MQIQTPPQDKEFDPIADLIIRFQVAYKVFTSKKAIVIIENEIVVFNTEVEEVLAVCSKIVDDLTPYVIEDITQNAKIKELLQSA